LFKPRKLWIRLIAAGVTLAGVAAIPVSAAQADTCTVTVTLASGQQQTFVVNVPAGTPLSAIPLAVTQPVVAVSESCTSGTSTTPTTTTSTGTTTTTSSSTTTSTTTSSTTTTKSTAPHTGGKGTSKLKGKHSKTKSSKAKHSTGGVAPGKSVGSLAKKAPKPALQGAGGVPAATNPTVSYALPGPAAIGVPNFFIDSFQIPPFLLPIYQAAGIEYDVPWQVLAAINQIETDYGRDLSVSSAGAVGWMQFLPSTWERYGVDATGSGYADPYNPVDAIFTAARYLQAAGAATNLSKAIFAYNHAGWYVQSVLLRAQLIGGMPEELIGALTDLVQGHFPVAAKATYADDSVDSLAGKQVHSANAAIPVDSTDATGTAIYAKQGSPVIAVNDGKIVKVGDNAQLGHYIVLQDATGNTYTYADLGSIPALYPVPKSVRVSAAEIARELSIPPSSGHGAGAAGTSTAPAPTPNQSATAGTQPTTAAQAAEAHSAAHAAARTATKRTGTSSAPLSVAVAPARTVTHSASAASNALLQKALVKERLFANPSRPASFAAGGEQQLSQTISNFQNYFSDVLHLGKDQYTLEPLKAGAIVVAGTILGRIGAPTATTASHLWFMIQPAGRNAPYIDPKPILDGWKLLEATAVYRAAGIDPFFGPGAKQAGIGEILLESKAQLQERVLADPHVAIYSCGRRDIQAGLIDRRILGTIEFLSASGLDPTISGLACGAGSNGIDAAGKTGTSMDISAINGVSIDGHQGPGSITDITIRRLLTLQGAMAPTSIISLMSYRGHPSTLSLPDHANRIQVAFTPLYGQNAKLTAETNSLLRPKQWIQLIQRISQIPEPAVPTKLSPYAIKTSTTG